MSCKGTLTVKGVSEEKCFIGIHPGVYSSLTRQNFDIPITQCGVLNISISRSPSDIDLVSVIPVEIKPDGIHVGPLISKSAYYDITINFDAHTNTLFIYPSTNWVYGGKLYMKSYWPFILVLVTLALLLVAVIFVWIFGVKKHAELSILEQANRHYKK
jgi:hypothetical protein